MKMFLAGQWADGEGTLDVRNPFDGSTVDTVPRASREHVELALAGAVTGAGAMRRTTARERSRILRRAAQIMARRLEELGRTISLEEGKVLAEGRLEAERACETMQLSADEALRLTGEVLPLDAAPGGAGKLGFTLRVPCGVVVAITPFNFPLNLVCHKVGPALAGGNSVIVKPASDTPLSALHLVEILLEAGLPPEAIACVTGSGSVVGSALCADPRVRKISFTGSRDVGDRICRTAGIKRVTLELGSNSPLIVLADADLERAAEAIVATGYANAGQTCISTQRVIVQNKVYDDVLATVTPRVAALAAGNQLDPATSVGPLIREADAARVERWIGEAVERGGRLLVGGARRGSVVQPAVVADVDPAARISCDELFGPAVAVQRAGTIDEAIALANDTRYGLSAGLFTRDLGAALRFAREVDSGNLHINWGPQWRADLMPYGGLKDSGVGKEGPRYAVQEMTELKTVVLHEN
jgi:acyl-CoA reductase-like NAD-dependent aldehyde dehydrogenase